MASLDAEISSGELESAIWRIYELSYRLASESPEFVLRYNQLPELDELVQTVGRELADGIGMRGSGGPVPGGVNVFIASELYAVGGHTRVLANLTNNSQKPNLVVLTDVFGKYERGELELGPIAEWLHASILVLPRMSLLAKVRNLLKILMTLPVNAVGILAHHQDVVAYAACNDRVMVPQIYVHHADYYPTLGATVAHYRHVDLTVADQRMCEAAGFVDDPLYMPLPAARHFQPVPPGPGFTTATAGSFTKFATEGRLNYADLVVAVLDSISGKHVHIGEIPPNYLAVVRDRIAGSGIDPARFVYLGAVDSLQQALIEHRVGVYVSSAPVGGATTYAEVLGLGLAILIYAADESANEALPITAFHAEAASELGHRRWRTVGELCSHLRSVDLDAEFEQSRREFSRLYPEGEFARITQSYF